MSGYCKGCVAGRGSASPTLTPATLKSATAGLSQSRPARLLRLGGTRRNSRGQIAQEHSTAQEKAASAPLSGTDDAAGLSCWYLTTPYGWLSSITVGQSHNGTEEPS